MLPPVIPRRAETRKLGAKRDEIQTSAPNAMTHFQRYAPTRYSNRMTQTKPSPMASMEKSPSIRPVQFTSGSFLDLAGTTAVTGLNVG